MKTTCLLPLLPALAVAGCSAHIEMTDHVSSASSSAKIIYVNQQQKSPADGTSWQRAFADLHDALAVARPGDEIRVARGVYLPSQTGDRNAAFHLRDGVKLYGGFSGSERERADRDVAGNPTILSGNIGDLESSHDDSFEVIVGDEELLDGITVRRGGEDDKKIDADWDHTRLTTPQTRAAAGTDGLATTTPLPRGKSRKRLYVDAAAAEGGDGTSWERAFCDLQQGLDAASKSGAELWIAEGRYLPAGDGRNATFVVRDGVRLYGSLKAGAEDRSKASTVSTPTILSGNIGDRNRRDDNCYHVVTAGHNVVISGVRIADGYADGAGSNGISGGLATPGRMAKKRQFAITLDRVIFAGNSATLGGAWFASEVQATLTTTYFKENRALYGGAIAAGAGTRLTFDNVHFFANRARFSGGALYLDDAARVNGSHCLFTNNRAQKAGGAVAVSGDSSIKKTTVLNLDDTLFSGNRGGLFGGAITTAGRATATLQGSHLHDNFAANGGDIAAFANAGLQLRRCLFIDEEGREIFRAAQPGPQFTRPPRQSPSTGSRDGNLQHDREGVHDSPPATES